MLSGTAMESELDASAPAGWLRKQMPNLIYVRQSIEPPAVASRSGCGPSPTKLIFLKVESDTLINRAASPDVNFRRIF
ncbi:hypothetical protein SAMN05216228_105316 [Rhizobium tibeticum]|uniref:Uncharacterized protein n=1 Tax=Rhizobium tibeticum TaxID=501024 RepID=A0ABY1AX08_9HYPH|nr:hypothetical protein SAMN05216228_105316 [Rhizobium tibeticum]